MLKKLRIKFVAIIMVIVTLVLTVAFSAICLVENQRANTNLEEAMQSLVDRGAADVLASENQKQAGGADGSEGNAAEPSSKTAPQDSVEAAQAPQAAQPAGTDAARSADGEKTSDDPKTKDSARADAPGAPHIGGPDRDKSDRYPIALYTLDAQGELTAISEFTTASIASDVLASAQASVESAPEGYGAAGTSGLHYFKRNVAGTTFVSFADTSNTDGWKSLTLTLVLVGAAVLAAFFVLSLLFSKWALRPVEEAWESQRRFVTDASHEIKTPLTVILANTSILLSHPEKTIATESKWLESTQVEAQRMQGLVGEMLALAQIEEQAAPASERIDLSDVVAGQVLEFESVAYEQNFALESEIAEGIEVNGNPERLHKLVSTLIENASKYVDERGTVKVELARKGKTARLSVSNSGSFIDPEDAAHVFDRFYRSDKARSSETGGFGLGLAIARETARNHGGDVTVESSREAGTRFTATLPLAQ